MQTSLSTRALACSLFLACAQPLLPAQCLQQTLQAPQPANTDGFGGAIDIESDEMWVGAWTSQGFGRVHLYERIQGSWAWQETLTPQNSDLRQFGWSLQRDGDWAIVGARATDGFSGAVAFYQQTAGDWVETQVVENPSPASQSNFGYAVALEGNTALVGLGSSSSLGVYVYEYDGASWQETQFLLPGSTTSGSWFGSVLELHGSLAFVSALSEDGERGAVYVYERGPAGWSEIEKLTQQGPGDRPRFGQSLSYDPDTQRLAVGAIGHNSFDYSSLIGSVSLYSRQGPSFVPEAQVLQEEQLANTFDDFGAAVSLSGDDLLVGACEIGWIGHGAQLAYHFRRSSGGAWEKVGRFASEGPHPYLDYGTRVLLQDGQAVVQEPGDGGGNAPAGSLRFYSLAPLAVPYCICSAGPCANDSQLGGCSNSQGATGAILTACGSSSVAADDLRLQVEGLPANQSLVAAMGAGAGDTPFGDGRLCISGAGSGLYRYALTSSDASGTATIGPGLVQFAADTFQPSGQLLAGSTWNYQVWYRDPAGPCGSGFNMSQALAVTWLP